jgi:hypothetical protein
MSEELNDCLDLIESLARTPDEVAALVSGLSPQALIAKNLPNEFSVLENVCHLRDIEVEGYTPRINRILNENHPLLPDVDGALLAIERDYNSQLLTEALDVFGRARQENVSALAGLNRDQFDREGVMEGVGEVTLGSLLLMMRDHDDGHLDDLRVIRNAANRNQNTSASSA